MATLASIVAVPAGVGAQDPPTCNGLVATIVGTEGDDTLQGTYQDDVIVGLGGNDTINGASGSDTICGGDGDDVIDGGSQDDTIFGDVGNDAIAGKSGADSIDGGAGDDVITGDSQNDTIHGGDGDDDINGGSGDDTLDGGNGIDVVDGLWQTDTCDDAETAINCETETQNGEPGGGDPEPPVDGPTCDGLAATIVGTEGDDVIEGTFGDDVIVALGGNDTITGLSGADTICGGDGDDTISGGSQNDSLFGEAGDDTLNGDSGDDLLDGGDGFDVLDGGTNNDTCEAGETVPNCETVPDQGNPPLTCNGLTATIVGTQGDDTLQGTYQDDVIVGLGGNDTINGASGSDTICGGDGDDVIDGGSQDDTIFGDAGNDTIAGKSGADSIDGGAGDDVITGDSQNDTIHGRDGDDDINGGSGDDTLDGSNGVDVVNGLWQTDTCDDAETAINCETETNNGEDDDGPVDDLAFLLPPADALVTGVFAVEVEAPAGSVSLSLDGDLVGSTDTAPYSFTVDVSDLADGPAVLRVEWTPAGGVDFEQADELPLLINNLGDGDGDGIPALIEQRTGASPDTADTDNDGLTDYEEIALAPGFLNPALSDSDGDGVPDEDEDLDGDGLSVRAEIDAGSSPVSPDTDRDRLGDEVEISLGTNPAQADSDGDGLSDFDEVELGSDPLLADSDGDGVDDSDEVYQSTAEPLAGVVVTLTGPGNLARRVEALEVDDVTGPTIGSVYSIRVTADLEEDLGPFESATVTLPLPDSVADPAQLAVFTWVEAIQAWAPAADFGQQTTSSTSISSPVEHFSLFAILDRGAWLDEISAPPVCAATSEFVAGASEFDDNFDLHWGVNRLTGTLFGYNTGFVFGDGATRIKDPSITSVTIAGATTETAPEAPDLEFASGPPDLAVGADGEVYYLDEGGVLSPIGVTDRNWSLSTGATNGRQDVSIAPDGTDVYVLEILLPIGVSTADGQVTAVDPDTGAIRWVSDPIPAVPVADALVNIVNPDRVVAIMPDGDPIVAGFRQVSGTTFANDVPFYARIDGVTGEVLWVADADDRAGARPQVDGPEQFAAVIGDTIYVTEARSDGRYAAIDAQTGSVTSRTFFAGTNNIVVSAFEPSGANEIFIAARTPLADGQNLVVGTATPNPIDSSTLSPVGFWEIESSSPVRVVAATGLGERYWVIAGNRLYADNSDGQSLVIDRDRLPDVSGDNYEVLPAIAIDEDSDGDGLTDCQEVEGFDLRRVDRPTERITTEPLVFDTDDDGLPDGLEMSVTTLEEAIAASPIDESLIRRVADLAGRDEFATFIADPTDIDSDNDLDEADPFRRNDGEEYNDGTNPLLIDGDFDRLPDELELLYLTDPNDPNTDGDWLPDGKETEQYFVERGFDPIVFDRRLSVIDAEILFFEGLLCGEAGPTLCPWVDLDDTIDSNYTTGSLITGFVALGDVTSGFAAFVRGDEAGVGLAAAGIIPIGDVANLARRVRKIGNIRDYIRNFDNVNDARRGAATTSFFRALNEEPNFDYIEDVLRQLDGLDNGVYDDLALNGLTEAGVRANLARGLDPARWGEAWTRAGRIDSPYSVGAAPRFTNTGAEDFVRGLPGFDAAERTICIPQRPCIPGSIRRVDAIDDVAGLAIEVKTGRQRLSTFLRRQIRNDARIVDGELEGIGEVQWHFFPNADGLIDIDPRLLDALDNPASVGAPAGSPPIEYVIHWP